MYIIIIKLNVPLKVNLVVECALWNLYLIIEGKRLQNMLNISNAAMRSYCWCVPMGKCGENI